jgi:hypothetical protein
MARRYTGHMNGERYLGNANKYEVHDLDNENVNCQINEIISAGNDWPYATHAAARSAGHDNCFYCIGNSTR